jgi:hypothetical protein
MNTQKRTLWTGRTREVNWKAVYNKHALDVEMCKLNFQKGQCNVQFCCCTGRQKMDRRKPQKKFWQIVGVQSRTECRPWNVRAQIWPKRCLFDPFEASNWANLSKNNYLKMWFLCPPWVAVFCWKKKKKKFLHFVDIFIYRPIIITISFWIEAHF